MDFEWDQAKSDHNLAERGLGFDFAVLIFEGETIESESLGRSGDEIRIQAIGEVEGLVLSVVFTFRGERRRIISARPASRKERRLWHAR